MIYTLENDRLCVLVSSRGAELRSVRVRLTGREQLWQRDPALWADSAPWLFPIVGQLKDGGFLYQGREYALPLHGFAARTEFMPIRRERERMEFLLTDSSDTRSCYPFAFALRICYHLAGDALEISASVRNPDRETLLFSLGAHPGFLCAPGDRLELGAEASVRRLRAEDHLLLPPEDEKIGPCVALHHSLFDRDALVLESPDTARVTLRRRDGTGVGMTFDRAPWLGLWSKPSAPLRYVCVEPWFGVDDETDADRRLAHKTGIRRLAAGEEFSMNLSIRPF